MLLERLIALVAPATCVGCGCEGAALCADCRVASMPVGTAVCWRCGRRSVDGQTCEVCRPHTELSGVTVARRYDGPVKELILGLKFHHQRAAAAVAAELIVRALPVDASVDVVTAVPVAAERYRERGYNQSRLVGRLVGRELRRPYGELLAREGSAHQLGGDRRTRFAQVQGAFYGLRRLQGERVVIVDDVVTTGATLSECACVLRAAGAGEVWGAVVARH